MKINIRLICVIVKEIISVESTFFCRLVSLSRKQRISYKFVFFPHVFIEKKDENVRYDNGERGKPSFLGETACLACWSRVRWEAQGHLHSSFVSPSPKQQNYSEIINAPSIYKLSNENFNANNSQPRNVREENFWFLRQKFFGFKNFFFYDFSSSE